MGFWKLIWVFPLVLALHNAEEAFWLPTWSQRFSRLRFSIEPRRFRVALVLITLLAVLLCWMSLRDGPHSFWVYLLVGASFVTWANVFVPHLAVTLVTRRLMPGTLTGVVLVLPSLTYLLVAAFRDRVVAPLPSLVTAGGLGIVLLCLLRSLLLVPRR